MIPYGRQDIDESDIEAVVRVLKSDWLTQGPAIAAFERAVASYCKVSHGVAVANATAALHIACMALGLGPGSRLWTSPNTFVASANCARYCGASVDFVDIDPRSYNMSIECLAAKLSEADRQGCLPHVVVPVHFAGQSCEMREIHSLSERYGFRILEDASHAIGAVYQGERVGGCRFSDIAVMSFHPVKIITSGEGGMALTNDAHLAEKMRQFRSHGITRERSRMTLTAEGDWYYEQQSLGYNYRMTDLQAALGMSQMNRLDAFVARRREIAARYDAQLRDLPLILPWQHSDSISAFHLYPIQVESAERRAVFDGLRKAGIHVNVHYIPVHIQPYYRELGFRPGGFPAAEAYYRRAISIPMFAALSQSQQDTVVLALRSQLQ